MAGHLIAVDWGTTNRRVYLLDEGGQVLATARDDRGIKAMPRSGYLSETASLRQRYGDLPIILAGMVGSARGWIEVPYLPCPIGLGELAAGLSWVEPGRTAIVPGLAHPDGDVMRGEEVQFLGAHASGLTTGGGLLCQPGTHCKWARLEQGRIGQFSTAMTGELFALLKSHSLLAEFLIGAVSDDQSFRDGVQDGLSGRLPRDLFRVRAAALLGHRTVSQSASFVSGLLIGHDVGGVGFDQGEQVSIIADPELGGLYASAVRIAGGKSQIIDSQAAFVSGIAQLWKARRS